MTRIGANESASWGRRACSVTLAGCLVLSTSCAPKGAAEPGSSAPAGTNAPPDAQMVSGGEKTREAKPEGAPTLVDDWWPNRLDLRPLKENAPKGDPVEDDFDYPKAFAKLDLPTVKKDIEKVLTTSQAWWPADWGHYGGLMIRLAWHSAGTYRVTDGRGGGGSGTIRFAPLNSWPDNVNLDKARRLLWPVKKKYGRNLSWADLIILSGNVALESMGFKTLGFGGGRIDVYEPTDINWGPETEWLADERFDKNGQLRKPLGATQMGLIYVNPEGPHGNADPLAAAAHIRMAFGRMAMNDEETIALIAGGHTLGKTHGAHKAADCMGAEPEAASLEEQGLGWKNRCGKGNGADTVTSGLEGAWTQTPTQWSHAFFANLFEYEWELSTSPGGAKQWVPKGVKPSVPDAHDPNKRNTPVMLTTDLALIKDPQYRVISERFYKDPKAFEAAFAKAWFKLTHRDMGPRSRLVGPEVPEPQIWQDPVPPVTHKLVTEADVVALKKKLLESGLSTAQLVSTAWAAAASYRDTDMRGGANGARLRLAPQKDWEVNRPTELATILPVLEKIQADFNKGGKKISLADLIVLAGSAAVEDAAKRAGVTVKVPFAPGRTDAAAEQTDVESFAVLEPTADGFRNYFRKGNDRSAAELLVDKADLLTLTAPEMTALLGGLRVLGANYDGAKHGMFTDKPGTLSNDFFVNLVDGGIAWKKSADDAGIYEGRNEKGELRFTATAVDLLFGANSQLRALSEVYAADDAKERFVKDFVAAWTKVMNLDRFDLPERTKG